MKKKGKAIKDGSKQKDALIREREYGKANIAKYTKRWSEMLNEISCKHLKTEVIILWHNFEKTMDYKDVEISLYMDWISADNMLHWRSLSSNAHSIEYMISFFYRGHKWIYEQLAEKVNVLINLWVRDYEENTTRAKTNELYLERMKYQLNCIKKREEYETVTANFSLINEKTSKYKILLSDMNFTLLDKFEELHNYTKEFTSEYLASTRRKQKMGAESEQRFELTQKDMMTNIKRTIKLEKLIHALHEKLKNLVKTYGNKLYELTKERANLHECFLIFRENLLYDKENDSLKHRVLTVISNDTFQNLERIARKGSVMLKCLSSCRRYETQREKVLAFPREVKFEDEQGDNKNLDPQLELGLFWQKVDNVDATRYALNEERIYLKRENQKLRQKIHSFCSCLQCPALPQIPKRTGKIPYTEGREMVKKQTAHKGKRRNFKNERIR